MKDDIDMEKIITVAVIIGMFVMLLVLDGNIDKLDDRVKQLEQVEEVKTNRQNIEGAKHEEQAKEIVSRGYDTTDKIYGIDGFSGKGTTRTFYHISDPVGRQFTRRDFPL